MRIFSTKEERYSTAIEEAIVWLEERGVPYNFLPPHQLKIGALNFWPGRGTITVDGEDQRRAEKGLAGLEAILVADELIVAKHKDSSGNAKAKIRFMS